jgi:ferredoxin
MTTEGCPFYSKKVSLSCYVFTAGRYKSLPAFINHQPAGNASFTITGNGNIECMDIVGPPIQAQPRTTKCINCMFCVFGCPGSKFSVSETYEISSHCNDNSGDSDWGPLPEKVSKAFKGNLLADGDFQSANFFNPLGRYQGFEDFTSVDETKNIAVWLGNTVKYLLGPKSRVSLEIPIDIPGADRDGRLDVTGLKDDYLIACETKTSFRDLMSDKRFVEQMAGYDKKLLEETDSKGIRYKQYLVIGGPETDLLPPEDPRSTSILGNESALFYKLLKNHSIQFISAKVFLLLGMKALLQSEPFDLEAELENLLGSNNAGLLTSGAIAHE